jgi:hypothetical protein
MRAAFREDIELLPFDFGGRADYHVASVGTREFRLHIALMWKLLITIYIYYIESLVNIAINE